MPKEEYLISAEWSARQETLSDCANDISNLLACLKAIDPLFAQWKEFEGAVTPDLVEALILKQVGSRETPNDSYHLSLSSVPVQGFKVFITVICGRPNTDRYTNLLLISMPGLDPDDQLLSIAHFKNIMECIVTSVRPLWAVARPDKLRWMKSERDNRHPEIGWVTYLCVPFQQMPTLTAPSHIESFAEGVLIIATNEPFVQLNPEHVVLTEKIDALLVDAGIFKLNTVERAPRTEKGIPITNNYPIQIDFYIEPYGEIYPMPPNATFEIVNCDEITIEEGSITIVGSEVYYNDVRIWHDF